MVNQQPSQGSGCQQAEIEAQVGHESLDSGTVGADPELSATVVEVRRGAICTAHLTFKSRMGHEHEPQCFYTILSIFIISIIPSKTA